MARQAREKSSTGIYHVMMRGINRQNIYEDDEDRLRFLETLKNYKDKSDFMLYGYCLMDNHVHLLLQEGNEPISTTVKRISSSYVFWYNEKYERCGHFFQERFNSEVVETDDYFLTVLRYIHQNPLKAGLVTNVTDYLWSSYNSYIKDQKIIDTSFALNLFSLDKEQARVEYKKFMSEFNDDECMEYQEKYKISDNEVRRIIEEKYDIIPGKFHLLDRKQKNEIFHKLKVSEKISIRQIARVTGSSKYVVEKA